MKWFAVVLMAIFMAAVLYVGHDCSVLSEFHPQPRVVEFCPEVETGKLLWENLDDPFFPDPFRKSCAERLSDTIAQVNNDVREQQWRDDMIAKAQRENPDYERETKKWIWEVVADTLKAQTISVDLLRPTCYQGASPYKLDGAWVCPN